MESLTVGCGCALDMWQAEKEAALIPSGMRVLPEQERTEMLDALGRTRAELEKQIQAQPYFCTWNPAQCKGAAAAPSCSRSHRALAWPRMGAQLEVRMVGSQSCTEVPGQRRPKLLLGKTLRRGLAHALHAGFQGPG